MIFLMSKFSSVFAFDKTTNQIVLCKCKKKFDTWLDTQYWRIQKHDLFL